MESRGRSMDSSHVALAASAVFPGVAVQNLPPESAPRDAHVVIVARDGGEVADGENDFFGGTTPTDEAEDALQGVVAVDPVEARGIEMELAKSGLAPVGPVPVLRPPGAPPGGAASQ